MKIIMNGIPLISVSPHRMELLRDFTFDQNLHKLNRSVLTISFNFVTVDNVERGGGGGGVLHHVSVNRFPLV